ncbi:MAG: alpha-amylase family glycosyl hydrolase [Anaeromyxobacteraceae bacterium]|nr:alpha-amylase family glycosyl hydrolase [Anaeromyxobacteraceae bacterium]
MAACAHAAPAAAPQAAPAALAPLPTRPWSEEVLYFVLVDRFVDGDPVNDKDVDPAAPGAFHGGDLKGLTAHLDEIASLGVTALWINPVVRNIPIAVTGAGFPDWGYHGYWADDFTRVDPRFGSEADLEALVRAAHARGIRVLLDVVYNHAGYNSAYLRDEKTRGYFRRECGDDDLTSCLSGLPDFETERPEVREWLLSVQLPWARRYGLDGFRLDTVKHVEHDFWQLHRRRVRAEVSKDFFLLGEVWGGDRDSLDPWFADDELDAGFDFGFQGSTLGWVMGRGRSIAYGRYLEARHRVRPGKLLAHFLSSHDVEGALSLLGGDLARFRLAAALQLTTAGLPTIYYGEEVGRAIGKWPENRSDMPWGGRGLRPGAGAPRDEGLRAWYRRLIALRRDHPSLSSTAGGSHRTLSADGDLLVFLREQPGGGDAVVVAVNRGEAPASARVARPPAWSGRTVEEALGAGGTVAGDGEGIVVTVPGRSVAALIGVPLHP